MTEDDIRDVIADETSRGKRPTKAAAGRKRRERINEIRQLMKLHDKQEFIDGLKRLSVEPGSPAFEVALRAWREYVEP